MGNGSLDFLNMIRNQADEGARPKVRQTAAEKKPEHKPDVKKPEESKAEKKRTEVSRVEERKPEVIKSEHKPVERKAEVIKPMEALKTGEGRIAVIDTETNWHDEVMSVGVAVADSVSFRCVEQRYYIIDPECRVGGYYSNALYKGDVRPEICHRDEAMAVLGQYLVDRGVTKILAYNAKFDLGHLPELNGFEWFDIMRLAAYRQYNPSIPEELPCCKTGRLKTNYGVEPILRMLSGNARYCEAHNAVLDAMDELKIVELLRHDLSVYEICRIN